MKNLLITLFIGLSALSTSWSQVLITDPVENGGGWTTITGGSFPSTSGGLTPQEGTSFYSVATASSGSNRGAYKYFSDDFIAGTYTVTYSIGDLDTINFITNATFLLLADTDNNGYNFSDRILTTTTSRPNPADGAWSTWTDTYEITAATENANGDTVLGHDIGFLVVSTLDNSGYAFDKLSISSIPEPSTVATLLAAGIGALAFRWRSSRARRIG